MLLLKVNFLYKTSDVDNSQYCQCNVYEFSITNNVMGFMSLHLFFPSVEIYVDKIHRFNTKVRWNLLHRQVPRTYLNFGWGIRKAVLKEWCSDYLIIQITGSLCFVGLGSFRHKPLSLNCGRAISLNPTVIPCMTNWHEGTYSYCIILGIKYADRSAHVITIGADSTCTSF